jgi:hypothetical protein
MTSSQRPPQSVPTLTEVVTWHEGAKRIPWQAPVMASPELAQQIEARVLHQVQLLLPGLIAQATKETLEKALPKASDN